VTGRLLTTREVGDLLGLSTATVLRRWRRGEIPGGIRLASNVLRFREAAIDEWLAGLEVRRSGPGFMMRDVRDSATHPPP
jgi:excisionase family DNA binding protein